MSTRPIARLMTAGEVADLARIGYRRCDATWCRAAPVWMILHFYRRNGREWMKDLLRCEEHAAEYRRRHPDTETWMAQAAP